MKNAFSDLIFLMDEFFKYDPWHGKQTFDSMKKDLLNELAEVEAELDAEDFPKLMGELGDLLWSSLIVFHLAKQKNLFSFEEVLHFSYSKHFERHPWVFHGKKFDSIQDLREEFFKVKENQKLNGVNLVNESFSLHDVEKLDFLIKRLLTENGFPWRKIDLQLFKKYLREEAEELIEEMHEDSFKLNSGNLMNELGDVLFNIMLASKYAELNKKFNFKEVIENVKKKMIRRKPHVLQKKLVSEEEALKVFLEVKSKEKKNS